MIYLSVLSSLHFTGVWNSDLSEISMCVKNNTLENMTDPANLTLLLTGEEEESQPGLSQLGYHVGHRLLEESFPPEGQ